MKRNAVIKQGALPLKQLQQDKLTFSLPSWSEKSLMTLWIVKAVIVKLTAPFSKDSNKVRLVDSLLCSVTYYVESGTHLRRPLMGGLSGISSATNGI